MLNWFLLESPDVPDCGGEVEPLEDVRQGVEAGHLGGGGRGGGGGGGGEEEEEEVAGAPHLSGALYDDGAEGLEGGEGAVTLQSGGRGGVNTRLGLVMGEVVVEEVM